MPSCRFSRDWWTARQRWPIPPPLAIVAMTSHRFQHDDFAIRMLPSIPPKMCAPARRADKGSLWLARVWLRRVIIGGAKDTHIRVLTMFAFVAHIFIRQTLAGLPAGMSRYSLANNSSAAPASAAAAASALFFASTRPRPISISTAFGTRSSGSPSGSPGGVAC